MRPRSQAGRAADRRGLELPRESPGRLATGQSTATPGPSKTPDRTPGRPGCVLNAYVSGTDLVLVEPDSGEASGVRLRRRKAEHSCFIRRADVDGELRRMLERHGSVVGISEEGDWTRVKWVSRGQCMAYAEALQAKGVPTFEAGIDPALRYLADNDVAIARPRVAWLDLETDSRVPFSRKEEMRILCWAFADERGWRIHGVLREDTDAAERELMTSLWEVLDHVDLVAAWNGDRFDFPVLRARTEARGVPGIEWHRWLWLDHLALFKRMNISASESGEEKQSYSLDAIGHAVLGKGKSPIDSTRSWDYWAAGGEQRAALVSYNEQDAELMVGIEEHTGYVELLLTLSDACGSFPDTRGANPTSQAESFLQRLAVKRGHKFPSTFGRREAEGFKGGYCMDPTARGIARGVHVCDFASLYPSIIRAWNISPETRMESRTADAVYAHCPLTGAMFDTSVEGLLPAAVSELMRLRRAWNERKAAEPPGTPSWKEADRRSTAYKIAANSFYGVVGLPTSRLYDHGSAEAVSQSGVWLIKRTIREAQSRKMNVVYADTDSAYVADVPRADFERFVAWCNEKLYPRMLREVGCREPDVIKLAYEKEFSRIVFVTAKRYAGRYEHYKGSAATEESKPEVKGLEYKRGDSIRLARQMQEEVINLLVGSAPEDRAAVYEEVLREWRHRMATRPLEVEDVLISKTLSKNLREYSRRKKKDGSWARQLPHIEVARVLKERGRDVAEGAKIGYVIVDGSAKPMEVIPAEDWDGTVDRRALWESLVAPPTLRLLAAAFPERDWSPWGKAEAEESGQQALL